MLYLKSINKSLVESHTDVEHANARVRREPLGEQRLLAGSQLAVVEREAKHTLHARARKHLCEKHNLK